MFWISYPFAWGCVLGLGDLYSIKVSGVDLSSEHICTHKRTLIPIQSLTFISLRSFLCLPSFSIPSSFHFHLFSKPCLPGLKYIWHLNKCNKLLVILLLFSTVCFIHQSERLWKHELNYVNPLLKPLQCIPTSPRAQLKFL